MKLFNVWKSLYVVMIMTLLFNTSFAPIATAIAVDDTQVQPTSEVVDVEVVQEILEVYVPDEVLELPTELPLEDSVVDKVVLEEAVAAIEPIQDFVQEVSDLDTEVILDQDESVIADNIMLEEAIIKAEL